MSFPVVLYRRNLWLYQLIFASVLWCPSQKRCANLNLLSRVSSVNIYWKYSRQCRLIIASFFCCPWQKFAVIAIYYREFILSSWTAATRYNIRWLSRVFCRPFKTKLAIISNNIASFFYLPAHRNLAIISAYYRKLLLLSLTTETCDNISLLSRAFSVDLSRR